ncbi:aldehyde dehydrogenase family protein [Bradyrhizobium prioriisuperbiae]|uniref:aldehyde dehydrogenase family protein n=1 Tax=Bradyrhizobium prioriisuperbiae TaxID=2854389 RepID=UPI0028E81905|nr:aldehyde dehydrogenase family protein [Bradyrhizobium prioritasuperba]
MTALALKTNPRLDELETALAELDQRKDAWARTSIGERIAMLAEIKEHLMEVAEAWAKTAARKKSIPAGSPLEGEEWLAGPYTVMGACNLFIETLSQMDGKQFLKTIPVRELPNGQIAARVMPHSIWDKLLMAGVTADVWMQPGVTAANLADNTASAYATPPEQRSGKIALVLGAGNVAMLSPLDCFHKLLVEHQVVILKLNPVNDYLIDFLQPALRPLIAFGALRIVRGGADTGAYLCNHDLVDEIHITGAAASHDAIVWGPGEEGAANRQNGTPRNTRRITSELGGVSPTIVVQGPWSASDIAFQAEQIVTQKLNNSGFNCIACQMLVLPESWDKSGALLSAIETTMKAAPPRPLYYPGASERMAQFRAHGEGVHELARNDAPACVLTFCRPGSDSYLETNEVFAPAMSVVRIAGVDAEYYLRAAVDYANSKLHGTLGANILIHPKTMRQIGRKRFEEIIATLRYGGIAINAWSGLGSSLIQTPWGAFPGHTLDDVQSGIGFVHNSFMFDKAERTVIEAPFRAFPRPAWFVTNRKADVLGRLMTSFQYRPGFSKLPRIIATALRG